MKRLLFALILMAALVAFGWGACHPNSIQKFHQKVAFDGPRPGCDPNGLPCKN